MILGPAPDDHPDAFDLFLIVVGLIMSALYVLRAVIS